MQTDPRLRLRPRTMSKLQLRQTLRSSFPGHAPTYNETQTPKTTTGTLTIGLGAYKAECDRGKEGTLRAHMFQVAKEAHEEATKVVEGV
jgi:hypothetical protein